jgi:hypothetical protein
MKKFYNELTGVTITINEEDLIGWRYGLTYSHLNDLGFKEVRENKQEAHKPNELIHHIKEIMVTLDCDAKQALEIIKFERGI